MRKGSQLNLKVSAELSLTTEKPPCPATNLPLYRRQSRCIDMELEHLCHLKSEPLERLGPKAFPCAEVDDSEKVQALYALEGGGEELREDELVRLGREVLACLGYRSSSVLGDERRSEPSRDGEDGEEEEGSDGLRVGGEGV